MKLAMVVALVWCGVVGPVAAAAAQERTLATGETTVALRIRDESAPTRRTQIKTDPRVPHVPVSTAMWTVGMFLQGVAALSSCGKGCEADGGPLVFLMSGAYGAGIGAVVGMVSRADARRGGGSSGTRFSGPSGRIGLSYNQLAFTSGALASGAGGSTLAIAIQLSPRISTHVEISPSTRSYSAAPGAISQDVLNNVIPAASRTAGFSAGIEQRTVSFAFTQLAGVQVGVWNRVRLEALGGIGLQAVEKRDYYPAFGQGGPIPGRYYILDFESPEGGVVGGLDAEIVIGAGLSLVPSVRYYAFGDPGGSFSYGIGAHWRIGR
jgi:hypothetical protein